MLALAQQSPDEQAPTTLFPHPTESRFWISGQINLIFQAHPDFRARYSGMNSLTPRGESKTSDVLTLYMGAQITRNTEAFLDIESAGGRGISDALGLAGFTNLDVVRNPSLGSKPYLARVFVRQTIPLSKERTDSDRGPLALTTKVPVRRLELVAGKFSTVDFFDVNSVAGDSHLQFLNWTVDNNGAYDYAADTRGYTYGAVAQYIDRGWSLRFGELLMPQVANGIDLEWNLRRARSENIELELRPPLLRDRKSVVRLLSYVNHANMGDYQAAIARFRQGLDPVPVIESTRRIGTVKYGFGVNVEQEISRDLRAFARFGWNEGRHESFAYSEVNQTVALGGDYRGAKWRRPLDKIGAAFVTNAISRDHQDYLRLGGTGFLLGDGNLNYGRENVFESYYNAHLWRGLFFGFDLQHITNPGYNRDRGPVLVPGLRLHLEL